MINNIFRTKKVLAMLLLVFICSGCVEHKGYLKKDLKPLSASLSLNKYLNRWGKKDNPKNFLDNVNNKNLETKTFILTLPKYFTDWEEFAVLDKKKYSQLRIERSKKKLLNSFKSNNFFIFKKNILNKAMKMEQKNEK